MFELDIRIEAPDLSLEFDPTSVVDNDYYILNVCIKLRNQGYKVKLLTFDKKMILKARAFGIERYPMEFPQVNVKSCDKYFEQDREIKQESLVPECIDTSPSNESLEALKMKLCSTKICNVRKINVSKRSAQIYNFEKPKPHNDLDIYKLDIIRDEGIIGMLDTSSVDLFMGVFKVVITKSGKIKYLCLDQFSSYYNLCDSDKIIIFTKLSHTSIKMEVGSVGVGDYFALEIETELKECDIIKINKKYHESIKEAYSKLLKIKLEKTNRVSAI